MLDLLGLILRVFFKFIDTIVYTLLIGIYNLLIDISRVNIFDASANGGDASLLSKIGNNLYILIGVIMLFKMAFSLIQYIIDPDKMVDKTKGGAKLITDLVITLGIIIALPLIFREIYNVQKLILKENIIGTIIMGQSEAGGDGAIKSGGSRLSAGLLMALTPISSDNECYKEGIDMKEMVQNCVNELSADDQTTFKNSNYYKYYVGEENTYEDKNSGMWFGWDLLLMKSQKTGKFFLDYKYLITTLVGAAMVWVLFLYCVDVAKRAVSLGFLQIIAPIPVISRLGGKDDQFNSWMKKTTDTFLSLFIKLATFYLAVEVVLYVLDNLTHIFAGISFFNALFAFIFICIGVFYFMKDIDKFLGDLFKGMGGVGFNPFKRTKGAIGMGAGVVSGAKNRFQAKKDVATSSGKKFSTLRALGSGAVGAVAGGIKGFNTAYNGKDGFLKSAGSAYNEVMESSGKAFDNYGKPLSKKMGIKTNYLDEVKKQKDTYAKYSGYEIGADGSFRLDSNGKKISTAAGGIAQKQDARGGTALASDYEGLIQHEDMRNAVASMVNAKNARNEAQSKYERLRSRQQAGDKSITDADLDAARIASVKASSVYDNAKANYDKFAEVYTDDAKAYSYYTAGEDRMKYEAFSNPTVVSGPQSSSGARTSQQGQTASTNNSNSNGQTASQSTSGGTPQGATGNTNNSNGNGQAASRPTTGGTQQGATGNTNNSNSYGQTASQSTTGATQQGATGNASSSNSNVETASQPTTGATPERSTTRNTNNSNSNVETESQSTSGATQQGTTGNTNNSYSYGQTASQPTAGTTPERNAGSTSENKTRTDEQLINNISDSYKDPNAFDEAVRKMREDSRTSAADKTKLDYLQQKMEERYKSLGWVKDENGKWVSSLDTSDTDTSTWE